MDRFLLRNARIVTPDEEIAGGSVLVEDGRITEVGPGLDSPAGAEVIDLDGLTLLPGLIDVHVHGGGGFSLTTADPEEILAYAKWVLSTGVTSFLATICAGGLDDGLSFARVAAQVSPGARAGANLLGLNLEGPFVNPGRRGALPASWMLPPDARTFDGIVQAAGDRLKLMTFAPELPGGIGLVRAAAKRGVRPSIGHTDAGYETARRAFDAGARHVTHAFNAMRPFHHRDPGLVGAAADSPGVTVEVIADGVHLHPAVVGLLVRALGSQRVVLVTDGVPPAGLTEGTSWIGGSGARLAGGRVVTADGTIAGSAATMDMLVRNVVQWGVASLPDAVRMASTVPAEVLGVAQKKGRLAGGYDADLVALDSALQPAMAWVGGHLAFSRSQP